ncbi:YiiD C-terminal domain-containing protein [Luteimonas sp. e5]
MSLRQSLQQRFDAIPMARVMGLEVHEVEPDRVRLHAPLGPNINDKGCAFGGSLASLMTLAGWALVSTRLEAAGFARNEVFVADSQIRYRAPLWGDLNAAAVIAPEDRWEEVIAAIAGRGRARIGIHAMIELADGGTACSMQARYAAFAAG